jgi:hypothetical protein
MKAQGNAPLAEARGSKFPLLGKAAARGGHQSPTLVGVGLPRRTSVPEGSPAPFHGGGLQGPFPREITAPGFSQGCVLRPAL